MVNPLRLSEGLYAKGDNHHIGMRYIQLLIETTAGDVVSAVVREKRLLQDSPTMLSEVGGWRGSPLSQFMLKVTNN